MINRSVMKLGLAVATIALLGTLNTAQAQNRVVEFENCLPTDDLRLIFFNVRDDPMIIGLGGITIDAGDRQTFETSNNAVSAKVFRRQAIDRLIAAWAGIRTEGRYYITQQDGQILWSRDGC